MAALVRSRHRISADRNPAGISGIIGHLFLQERRVVERQIGWIAVGVSVVFTIAGLYFAATGANGSFIAMSSLAVIAVAAEVAFLVQVAIGQAPGARLEPINYSMTFALAGIGVILLAGAFALLANGMPLGFLSFGFSLGLIASSVGSGALGLLRGPAAQTRS